MALVRHWERAEDQLPLKKVGFQIQVGLSPLVPWCEDWGLVQASVYVMVMTESWEELPVNQAPLRSVLLYLCHCRKVTNTASQCHWGGMDYRRSFWDAGKELSVLSFATRGPTHIHSTPIARTVERLLSVPQVWNHWTTELFLPFLPENGTRKQKFIVERIQTVNMKEPLVWLLVLLLSNCVTLDKLFTPPTSQFPNM